MDRDYISPTEITENLCKRFRQFLLNKFTGETPGGYFARFKWVVAAATSEGYFQKNPTSNVSAKFNPSKTMKENLESDEYLKLLNAPCLNEEVKAAFIFSCYTGLRWVDVKDLKWVDIQGSVLTTRIIQAKTGTAVTLSLHPIAASTLKKQQEKNGTFQKVFILPSADGANKVLNQWVRVRCPTFHGQATCLVKE